MDELHPPRIPRGQLNDLTPSVVLLTTQRVWQRALPIMRSLEKLSDELSESDKQLVLDFFLLFVAPLFEDYVSITSTADETSKETRKLAEQHWKGFILSLRNFVRESNRFEASDALEAAVATRDATLNMLRREAKHRLIAPIDFHDFTRQCGRKPAGFYTVFHLACVNGAWIDDTEIAEGMRSVSPWRTSEEQRKWITSVLYRHGNKWWNGYAKVQTWRKWFQVHVQFENIVQGFDTMYVFRMNEDERRRNLLEIAKPSASHDDHCAISRNNFDLQRLWEYFSVLLLERVGTPRSTVIDTENVAGLHSPFFFRGVFGSLEEVTWRLILSEIHASQDCYSPPRDQRDVDKAMLNPQAVMLGPRELEPRHFRKCQVNFDIVREMVEYVKRFTENVAVILPPVQNWWEALQVWGTCEMIKVKIDTRTRVWVVLFGALVNSSTDENRTPIMIKLESLKDV